MATGFTFTKDTSGMDRLRQSMPAAADQMMRAVATAMTSEIVLSFGTSPSAPGDPPGVDTGALRASMHVEPDSKPLSYFIADGVVYGVYQELGTATIAPRPFVSPVFVRWQQTEFARFAQAYGLMQRIP